MDTYIKILVCFLFRVDILSASTVLTRVENLLLVYENSTTSIVDYWNQNETDNNPNDDKHVMPIYQLIKEGNFRSGKIDQWDTNPPNEVAIMFFNKIGDLHFWMVFNTRNVTRGLDQWMRVDRLLGSLIMNMYQMMPSWSQPGYQFLFSSAFDANKAWFAVTNRSIFTGQNEYPFFLVPLRDSVPFTVLSESDVVTNHALAELGEFGPFLSQDVIQIDLSGLALGSMVYVLALEAITPNTGSTGEELYKLLYSTDVCNTEDRVTYRQQDGMILQLRTNKHEQTELLRVRCLWLSFDKTMSSVTVKLFGPAQQDFIHLPIMVFRGFWYGEASETTVRPTTERILTTTEEDVTTVPITTDSDVTSDPPTSESLSLSTARTCTCPCHHTHVDNSPAALDLKIKNLKRTMAINKTQLSSHVRKYISVPDGRASAAGIGYVAGVFLVLVVTTIAVLDLSTLVQYLATVWKY
ncbi:uncharacterized protein [Argopecten irradians]|uniref:uncharacterized protein isoform X2 n=1 Tax=Argopecten irradians TaxID=31199 RepID=UPI003714B085